MHNSGASRREIADSYSNVIACDKREAFAQGSSDEAIHSYFLCCTMDCFAEPVIGRAFARPVGSQ
jgi:hypothetical protein